MAIDTPTLQYMEMLPKWLRIAALMGGTDAMRAAGTRYLPRFKAECDDDYQRRLEMATLYPALSETVSNMTGRVFSRPIDSSEVASALQSDLVNIDLQGNALSQFAAQWFTQALAYGMSHVLVDSPVINTASNRRDGVVSLADYQRSGARPYVRIIEPQQVIGWRVERVNNVDTLTRVRIRETDIRTDDDYNQQAVERVRVITPSDYQVWKHSRDSGWAIVEEGDNQAGVIPLVTLYTGRTGILRADPPLDDLAHLNIKHWQEQSDQDQSVGFARIRMMFTFGADPDQVIQIAPDMATNMPQDAKAEIIQGSSESVKVGADALASLEGQMKEAGAKLLKKDQGKVTSALQARTDAIVEQSALGRMAQDLEDAIDKALSMMAMYRGSPDAGNVSVNDDFNQFDDDQVDDLQKLVMMGSLSEQSAFEEAQRRGIVSRERDWETEQERIGSETPAVTSGLGRKFGEL